MTSANPKAPRPDGVHPPATDRGRVADAAQSLPAAYFASPIPGSLKQRRILLLSYHFPPSPEAGALRWQKLAGLVAESGWGLDVVALDPSQLKRQELDRYQDLPLGTRVFGVRDDQLLIERMEQQAWRVYSSLRSVAAGSSSPVAGVSDGTAGKTTRIKSPHPTSVRRDELRWQLWHPSGWRRTYYAGVKFAHDRAWARRAAGVARAVAQPGMHRLIISCGPPHLAHLAGYMVSKATGLPLVVDMRDPWSLEYRFQTFSASPLQLLLATRTERRIIKRTSLVVMNTPTAAEMMLRAYPEKPVLSVLNGYDEEPLPPIPPRPRFVIAYAGSIYLDRDPRLVFRAGAAVVRELGLTPEQFGFEFIGSAGSYGTASVEDIAAEEGIAGYVRSSPGRPRNEAMAFLAQASVLLSLPQETSAAIPSKIYEYMRFPSWLLVLTEAGSGTDRVLAGSSADVVKPDDVDGMTAMLRRSYLSFAAGERPDPVATDPRLSRRHQAAVLLKAIAGVTGEP